MTKQEPVAWYGIDDGGEKYLGWDKHDLHDEGFAWTVPLYTAPPKKEWVGLTVNEARAFYEKYTDREELIYAIDEFLEDKNNER